MNRWTPLLVLLLATSVTTLPAFAQASSEAKGIVTDVDGNPIADVVIIFHAESNPAMEYTGKSSKKGRYFVPGMFTGKQGDRWIIRVEAEGLVPVEMRVESRTGTRTLISDPQTVTLRLNQKIPPIIIRPLGSAEVDFKMSPPDRVAALQAEADAPDAAAVAAAAAEAQANAARQKDPYDSALTTAQSGDLEGSVEYFDKAIEKKPEDSERHRAYAQVLYQLGQYDHATTEAQKAVELDSTDVNALMVLYGIYVKQGELGPASTVLAQARAIDPANIDLLRQVAFVAGETGTVDEQVAAYEAIATAAPEDNEAWLSLGDLYAKNGQNAKSEAAYQKVIELDPTNADQIFFNLGALLINEDDRTDADTQKAIGAFRKAVEINPKYAQAYRELAFALLNAGDKPGAREALVNYVTHAPNAADVAQMKSLIEAL